MARVTEFDASAYLVDDEVVAEYLTAALEDSNPGGGRKCCKGTRYERDCREQRSRSGKPVQGADAWSKAALRHGAQGPAESRRKDFSVCGLTRRSTERGSREMCRLNIHRRVGQRGRWPARQGDSSEI